MENVTDGTSQKKAKISRILRRSYSWCGKLANLKELQIYLVFSKLDIRSTKSISKIWNWKMIIESSKEMLSNRNILWAKYIILNIIVPKVKRNSEVNFDIFKLTQHISEILIFQ